jgi:phospholipid/cholesterol/gamma-HCH transport system permease protein
MLRLEAEAGRLVAAGDWRVTEAASLDRALRRIAERVSAGPLTIDLAAVARLDSAGAWLVVRTRRSLEARGVEVRLAGLDGAKAQLVERIEAACAAPLPPPPRVAWPIRQLATLGAATQDLLVEAIELLGFFGAMLQTFAGTLVRPWRLRVTSFSAHVVRTGVEALPIVGLLSFLIGMVLAFQGASELTRFGADIFTVNLLAVSILREIGVLMTAIIVAGRSGSAFTAQIGTMVVNEEVDAMRTLGLDPMEVLVLPRVLALMVALPLLAFFANLMGLLGGGLMTLLVLDIPPTLFLEQLRTAAGPMQLFVGLVKAPVFAFVIAMVGCRNGLRVSGDAASVGRLTTQAVVTSIFLVIVIDAVFSIAFNILGI